MSSVIWKVSHWSKQYCYSLLISLKDTHLFCRRPESKFHFLFLLSFFLDLARQFLQIAFVFCPWNWKCNAINMEFKTLLQGHWQLISKFQFAVWTTSAPGKIGWKKMRSGTKALTKCRQNPRFNQFNEATLAIWQKGIIKSDLSVINLI